MTRDWPTAAELKDLKATDPDRYRRVLDSIAERRGVAPELREQSAPTGRRSGLDALVDHLRRAYSLTEGQTSQLGYIRRGAIYACVTLRADMLSGLPIRVYRLGTGSRGRRVDVRDPLRRLGMPTVARGVRLAEVNTVSEVEGSDIARRLSRPNEDWTGRLLMRMTEIGLGLTGQAHWQLHGRGSTASQPPTGISWVRHNRVSVKKAGPNDQARTIAGWILDEHTAGRQELQKGELLWMRYPDPEDPDFGVLAPADVARLGADSYHDAMQSNRDIFRRGLQTAGVVTPPEGAEFMSEPQMDELERDLSRKLTARDARHRLAVLRYRFDVKNLDVVSPKDAEFVALMSFAIEDAARVYRVPIEFIGGTRRTYQNMEAAFKGVWMMALEPEAAWLADELSYKVVPAFQDEADFVAFDLSEVVSLQEDEAEKWRRAREQIEAGVLLRNEWREEEGQDSLPWGDAWWAPMGLVPIASDEIEPAPAPEPETEPEPGAEPTSFSRAGAADPWAYGGESHRDVMERRGKALDAHERRVQAVARELLVRQQDSLRDKLKAETGGLTVPALRALFAYPRWVREFRERMRSALEPVVADAAKTISQELERSARQGPRSPATINFLRSRAQRFAERVNDTTWRELKASLEQGIDEGEDARKLAGRVEGVMASRIGSTPAIIARTEVLGAFSGGSLIAAKETGLDLKKRWLSALDDRVRDDHREAHGQTVLLDDDFEVGGVTGPGPGLMDEPEQDCQCRCTAVYGEDLELTRAVAEVRDAIHETRSG